MYMYEEQNNKSTLKSTIIILHVQRLWYNNDEPYINETLNASCFDLHDSWFDRCLLYLTSTFAIDISWIPVQAYST